MMKKNLAKKTQYKVTKKDYLFLGVFLIAVIFVISTCLIYRDLLISVLKDSNNNYSQSLTFEGDNNQLNPNSEITYTIKANSPQSDSKIVSLKIEFKDITVLGFTAKPNFISIGTCEEGKDFLPNKICIDLGDKEGLINKDEKLGEIKLKLGNDTKFSAITEIGNGFYNGKIIALDENSILISNGISILPITGGTESVSVDFANYPLFIGITIFIVVSSIGGLIYLAFLKTNKEKKQKIASATTAFGVFVLFFGIIFITNNLNSSERTIENLNALEKSEEYKTQADKTLNISTNCAELKASSSWGGAGLYCSTNPLGYLINCNSDGGAGSNPSMNCVNGCQIMPAGQADYCKMDATIPNSIGNEYTCNDITYIGMGVYCKGNVEIACDENKNIRYYYTFETEDLCNQACISTGECKTTGSIACGKTGCQFDSDCVGFIDNKTEGSTTCEEVQSNDPAKQTCSKICKYGYTNNDMCSCSQTPPITVIDCGPMDTNSDKILNYIDMYEFLKSYSKTCSNGPLPSWSCGGQDSNNDKIIDYKDTYALVSNYFPNISNCTGMPGGK